MSDGHVMGNPEPLPRIGGPSDAALVVAARAGEAWACESLYRRHVGQVHGLACRLLGRDVDVDDIVQESFIAAFASLENLEDPNAFRSWICGVTVRKTCKLIRHRKLLSRLGLRRPEAPVEIDRMLSKTAPPDVVAELRAVYAVLGELPADVRVALLLRRVEGATLEEIAELTETSLATVKRRITKGGELLAAGVAAGGGAP